jgi:hypothetical protein
MVTEQDLPDGWVMGHKQPLATALPEGRRIHAPNHKAERLRESDQQELYRLGEVITANLACGQTPLKNGRHAPCMICRKEANRAMMLYLDTHNIGVDFRMERRE